MFNPAIPLCCPLCKVKCDFEGSDTDGADTTFTWWCKNGHLVQAYLPENYYQVFPLDEEGEEGWVLGFNTEKELIHILDWEANPAIVSLEGTR